VAARGISEETQRMGDNDLTVHRIMIEDPRTVLPQAPAIRAAQIMVQDRIRHLIVAENNGQVVGVLSERQVLKHFSPWLSRLYLSGEAPTAPPRFEVRQIMAEPAVTVTEDTSIRRAAGILGSKKIGCLPVVKDGDRLVGLVTAVDVLKFAGRQSLLRPEEEFQVFRPPAFLSKDNKLTVPVGYFAELSQAEDVLAVLAYAAPSKRIGVKLFARGQAGADLLGARPATVTDKYLAIPAADFLEHHGLNIRGPLVVAEDRESGYLILSPVLKP
jgi:CBS domain-containing protein